LRKYYKKREGTLRVDIKLIIHEYLPIIRCCFFCISTTQKNNFSIVLDFFCIFLKYIDFSNSHYKHFCRDVFIIIIIKSGNCQSKWCSVFLLSRILRCLFTNNLIIAHNIRKYKNNNSKKFSFLFCLFVCLWK
jgi:hypothetical protein